MALRLSATVLVTSGAAAVVACVHPLWIGGQVDATWTVVGQMGRIVAFGLAGFGAGAIIDYLIVSLTDPSSKSDLKSFIQRDILRWNLGSKENSSSTAIVSVNDASPSEQLQDELELVLRKILKLYVSSWADLVSPCHTLDKEVQNDLRRCLYELMDRIKAVDARELAAEALEIIRHHLERLNAAMAKDSTGGDFASKFSYSHPVHRWSSDAKKTSFTREEYVLSAVERLLSRFKVNRTISTESAFHAISSIVCRQVALNLMDVWTDPEMMRGVIAVMATAAENRAVNAKEEERESKSEAESETVENNCEGAFVVAKPPASLENDSNAKAVVACKDTTGGVFFPSPDGPLKWKYGGAVKKSHDLTGYSVRYSESDSPSFGCLPFDVAKTPVGKAGSGVISAALGGLFSATAGPLLPDNIAFKSFNKMWRSSSQESDPDEEQQQQASESPSSAAVTKLTSPRLPGRSSFSRLSQRSKRQAAMVRARKHFSGSVDESIMEEVDVIGKGGGSDEHRALGRQLSKSLVELDLEQEPTGEGEDEEEMSLPYCTPRRDPLEEAASVKADSFSSGGGGGDDSRHGSGGSDLESTITKLRALLQEKKDQGSLDSTHSNKLAPDCSLLSADELPSDGRLILNVRIPEAETSECPVGVPVFAPTGGVKSPASTTSSLLVDTDGDDVFPPVYCVTYDGIYLQPVSPPGSAGREKTSFRYIKQPRLVKRRFKEFLNLHHRLDSKLRAQMKGLSSPRQQLERAGSNGAKITVETRRLILEAWLIALCDRAAVAVSPDMKEFLAYEDDGLAEFVAEPTKLTAGANSGQGKIDKFLSKTVSGVFHSIKDALPNFDDESNSKDHSCQSMPEDNSERVGDGAGGRPRQLALPALYAPSGVRVSPVWTPQSQNASKSMASELEAAAVTASKKTTPASGSTSKAQQYNVDFAFVSTPTRSTSTDREPVSEFESTLEFHVQRCEHRQAVATKKQQSIEAPEPPSPPPSPPAFFIKQAGGAMTPATVVRGTGSMAVKETLKEIRYQTHPQVRPDEAGDRVVEAGLELLSNCGSSVDSDLVRTAVKALLVDVVDPVMKRCFENATTESAWTASVARLREVIWGDDLLDRSNSFLPDTSYLFWASKTLLGIDLRARLELMVSDRRVNEDLILSLFDLLLAHLTVEDEEEKAGDQRAKNAGEGKKLSKHILRYY